MNLNGHVRHINIPANYDDLNHVERKYVRDHYVRIQNGRCWHCDAMLDREAPRHIKDKSINRSLFPQTFFKYPVHLHHDHNTGLTIGAVHNYCNAVLWQYYGE